jgi:VIT1/CCC1 family predicted Fe2+/Mn2+ transporter
MSDYLVSKYYEISACQTVVAGTMPSSGESIWGDNYIALRTDMSDREILGRLSAALADPEGLRRMADRMYDKIHRYHSLNAFVPAVNEILREIHADTSPAAAATAGPPVRAINHPSDLTR